LFVNTSTNQSQLWLMNGTQVTSVQAPASNAGPVAPSNATALSNSPVLGQADGYFPSGTSGFGGALLAGPDLSGVDGRASPQGASTSNGRLFTPT
jgi:hypothetical protein